jgi:hypothetical protein
MDPELSESSRRAVEGDPEILTAGYTVGPPGGEWVCPTCFKEFAGRFDWQVKAS